MLKYKWSAKGPIGEVYALYADSPDELDKKLEGFVKFQKSIHFDFHQLTDIKTETVMDGRVLVMREQLKEFSERRKQSE